MTRIRWPPPLPPPSCPVFLSPPVSGPIRPRPNLPVVEVYFTEKEIIGKNSEKGKRGEEEQKRTEDVPVVPASRIIFAASVGHVPSRPAYCCTLRKKRQPKRRGASRRGEQKEYKKTEDALVGCAFAPVPSCVAVAVPVVPVPLCFVLSRPDLMHSPSSSRQAPVDGEKVWEKEQQKISSNQILSFVIPNLGPAARNSYGGETTDGRQRDTKKRGRKHKNSAEFTF